MKKTLFVLLFASLFTFCSNARNELSTKLVNNKKALEDSIKDATNYEHYYQQQARSRMNDADTNLWKRLSDTSAIYYMKRREYAAKLEATNFSLDSLSHQK